MTKLLLSLALFLNTLFAESGNHLAETAAKDSPSVKAAYDEMIKMVEKMQVEKELPEALKKASLSLLTSKGSGAFKFAIQSRHWNELEITKELTTKISKHLGDKPVLEMSEYNSEKTPLFPKNEIMPFIAAPVTATGGHHVYPGGLVHHTYTNMLSALKLAETYEKTYQTKITPLEKNLGVLSALWHDAAKPWVLKWNEDGTLTGVEGKIAGTAAHHIWVLAELAIREMPADFIVSVAGAHDAVIEGQASEQKVINYLLAASIISGKSLSHVGLQEKEGIKLITLPRLAHYLNNLGDADWCFSVPAQKKAFELSGGFKQMTSQERWKRLSHLSKVGEIPLYHAWKTGGESRAASLLKN